MAELVIDKALVEGLKDGEEVWLEPEELVWKDEEQEEITESKSNKFALAIGAAAVVALGIGAYKLKDKYDEWSIKRLEKKGYVISKIEVLNTENNDDVKDAEVIEDETNE